MEDRRVMTERRKRGRPSVVPGRRSADLSLKVSEDMYDAAYQRASKDRKSLPEIVRLALARYLAL
jgi:hypothetical protein